MTLQDGETTAAPKDKGRFWTRGMTIVAMILATLIIMSLIGAVRGEEDVDYAAMVDAFMANPEYTDKINIDEDAMVEALMRNPAYINYLDTTPREDCATIILSNKVAWGEPAVLPTGSDVDDLCAWYAKESQ